MNKHIKEYNNIYDKLNSDINSHYERLVRHIQKEIKILYDFKEFDIYHPEYDIIYNITIVGFTIDGKIKTNFDNAIYNFSDLLSLVDKLRVLDVLDNEVMKQIGKN